MLNALEGQIRQQTPPDVELPSTYIWKMIGRKMFTEFSSSGGISRLLIAISAWRRRLDEHAGEHPMRAEALSDYGLGLYTLYKQAHRVEDLEMAVECYREVVILYPKEQEGRMASLNNFALALNARYQISKQMEDLTESIK